MRDHGTVDLLRKRRWTDGWAAISAGVGDEPAESLRVGAGGDLDRVERRALAQVIDAQEEREAALAARDGAQPADEHRVAALDVERHGVALLPSAGRYSSPGAARSAASSSCDGRVALRAEVERDAMAGVDRHAHRRGGHVQVRQLQDLADLGV